MFNNIVGIDPGTTGAIALYNTKRNLYKILRVEFNRNKKQISIKPEIIKSIFDYEPAIIIIEQVHSHPQQGVVSTFTFGNAYGQILGSLSAYAYLYKLNGIKIDIKSVHPLKWKKELGLNSDKHTSVDYVKDYNINYQLLPVENKRLKLTHDRADAICLVEYYKKRHRAELIKLRG